MNHRSQLLLPGENEAVFELLGPGCQSLATAVVQLLLTEPPSHSKWIKQLCGVACFVKDSMKRSFFIRVFDISQSNQQIWEQKLYDEFKYCTPKCTFHTFEAQQCRTGLNFADEQEADQFKNAVQQRMRNNQTQKARRRTTQTTAIVENSSIGRENAKNIRNAYNPSTTGIFPSISASENVNLHRHNNKNSNSYNKLNNQGTRKRNKDKKGLSKADISAPIVDTFQHVQHAGWDLNTGLDVHNADLETMDPQLKILFGIVGITEEHLKDDLTRESIYDAIQKNNFFDKFHQMLTEENVSNAVPPPVPERIPPALPVRSQTPSSPARVGVVHKPPPIPERAYNNTPTTAGHNRKKPPRPVLPNLDPAELPLPPPPPPELATPAAPLSPLLPPPPSPLATAVTPPSVLTGQLSVPPPPPPPPPPAPPTPLLPDSEVSLLQNTKNEPIPKANLLPSARDQAMSEIRRGVKLKKVDKDLNEVQSISNRSSYNEMAMILRDALEKRAVALQNSDDEGDDYNDDDDDDDWDC